MATPEVGTTTNTNKLTTLEQLKLLAIRAHAADTDATATDAEVTAMLDEVFGVQA